VCKFVDVSIDACGGAAQARGAKGVCTAGSSHMCIRVCVLHTQSPRAHARSCAACAHRACTSSGPTYSGSPTWLCTSSACTGRSPWPSCRRCAPAGLPARQKASWLSISTGCTAATRHACFPNAVPNAAHGSFHKSCAPLQTCPRASPSAALATGAQRVCLGSLRTPWPSMALAQTKTARPPARTTGTCNRAWCACSTAAAYGSKLGV